MDLNVKIVQDTQYNLMVLVLIHVLPIQSELLIIFVEIVEKAKLGMENNALNNALMDNILMLELINVNAPHLFIGMESFVFPVPQGKFLSHNS